MSFEFVRKKGNTFYTLDGQEVGKVEADLKMGFPTELKQFYNEVGYGFFSGSEYNINRLMDPESVRDFRKRAGDFEVYPDIEIYDEYEDGKLIFFEANESALISIGIHETQENPIFYYDIKIANSLKEFLEKIMKDDNYYIDLPN
ncbi:MULTISPECIES: SMI1/KNR4 family protein [Listeria]|uniref:SMI1/KNR4 family protein n=1 Tax=Listeria TaxID=1637 RepID=UPI000B5872E0|nr:MULTISPECIES: SMI1/KNR4 family protein [Listeria]